MAKEARPQVGGEAGPASGDAPAPVAHGNTLKRARTVIQSLKLSPPVAAGVLAQHGLDSLSMVDPAVFAQQVKDWLASPAQK